jgi:hypothetical protein
VCVTWDVLEKGRFTLSCGMFRPVGRFVTRPWVVSLWGILSRLFYALGRFIAASFGKCFNPCPLGSQVALHVGVSLSAKSWRGDY